MNLHYFSRNRSGQSHLLLDLITLALGLRDIGLRLAHALGWNRAGKVENRNLHLHISYEREAASGKSGIGAKTKKPMLLRQPVDPVCFGDFMPRQVLTRSGFEGFHFRHRRTPLGGIARAVL